MIQRHPAGWPILVVAEALSTGRGVHYWQRAGADVQDFQQDSRGRVTEAIACRQPSASRPPGVVCRSR
ncbi:MAG: hypothetical protein DME00_30225 [Candidatus Rokuibacteriota bacterium]|nr:MAG: hypothetical protein DME00_30225 [Candidatus Rokubacteria bacterium]PYO06082.1 MAG: hypothetical protein DMD75_25510 [Candidatus Rokubacteria bacterium]